MEIKVYGPGCARCKETEQIVKAAVQEAGSSATVEKISDLTQMMAHGIMSTPAVAIDDKVVCSGRIPSKSEVMGWIATPDANVFGGSASSGCCCGGKC